MKDDELEGLSEEEIAALEEEEADLDDDLDEEADLDEEDPEDDEDGGDDDDQDNADQDGDDDDPDSDGQDDEEDDEPDAPEEFIPQYQADPVEDYDQKMADISDQKRDLRQKYRDGDMDLDEYEDARDKLESEALQLREANLKATMAAEQSQQTAQQRWEWEQERFFGKDTNKIYQDDPLIGSAFNTAVKSLANDEKYANKPMSWFLEEADRMTRDRFSVSKDGDDKTNQRNRRKGKKSDRSKLPPNLGDLPAADQAETGGDEFSRLDSLEGIDLERELAKLSPTEQDRYLKG